MKLIAPIIIIEMAVLLVRISWANYFGSNVVTNNMCFIYDYHFGVRVMIIKYAKVPK